jgi:hypothetical protein
MSLCETPTMLHFQEKYAKKQAPGVSEKTTALTAEECDKTARLIRCAVAWASQSLDMYLARCLRGTVQEDAMAGAFTRQ